MILLSPKGLKSIAVCATCVTSAVLEKYITSETQTQAHMMRHEDMWLKKTPVLAHCTSNLLAISGGWLEVLYPSK